MAADNEIIVHESNEIKDNAIDVGGALDRVIEHVGELGLYQRLLFVCMLPFGMVWAFVYMGQIFITATPQEHWCRVPELAGLSVELRRTLSIPEAVEGNYDHCRMYDANWTQVLQTLMPPEPGTPTVPCQHGWEFLFDDIPYSTVVNEREWVCDQASNVPWSQTINFVGSIFGGIICGTLADKYGRLPVLIFANIVGCLGGVATMFTNGFWDFSMCRFIVGMSCDSCFMIIYILVLEYVGTRYRTLVANMSIALYFGGGCLLLPWLALWISDWRYFVLATSLPMLLAVFTPLIVPESARWLVSKGKVDDAVKLLKRFERLNQTKIPQQVMDDFIFAGITNNEKEDNIFTLLRTPSLRKMLALLVITFSAVAVIFDGIIRMSENLGLDLFITFAVTSASEIPSIGILVFLLDRFGRRKLVFIPVMVSGILSLITAFLPRGVATVSVATLARFFINMAYGAIIQWTPELLPTATRASGASLVHISAFGGLVVSPFIVYSERAWEGLPLIIIAVLAVISGAAALFLPETAGRSMPQTMEDWHQLAATAPCHQKQRDTEASSGVPVSS
ncbi:PREDICTED: solute carrier family 22 member 3-like [Papilio xuthus]|uniref:Solute carrier family 22 member 3-like n=1 Tax=Papilio xuthus TaxID=66420 RepID=A0AAJ6Z1Y4_PAPXU|nr:PREDICTED: solute carrier family 22 member 3-like [Papilio xuthus]XP_013163459.1 PREDICTED: solute carrier family 22 member 3-like [Papilio xuthus]